MCSSLNQKNLGWKIQYIRTWGQQMHAFWLQPVGMFFSELFPEKQVKWLVWHFIDICRKHDAGCHWGAKLRNRKWSGMCEEFHLYMLFISSVKHFCVCNLSLKDMKILKYKGLLRTENERKVWESKTTRTFDTLTTGLEFSGQVLLGLWIPCPCSNLCRQSLLSMYQQTVWYLAPSFCLSSFLLL